MVYLINIMTTPTLIKKALKDSILEAIRNQKEGMRQGEKFVPYSPPKEENIRGKNPSVRLEIGKAHEKNILDTLAKYGNVVPATVQEDIRFKIDGTITFTDPEIGLGVNKPYSVQIKKRSQSGDDVLFEVERDFDQKTMGRDRKGNSELYIVADRSGRIGIFKTERLKAIVNALLKKEPQRLEQFRGSNRTGLVVSIQSGEKKAELRVTEGNGEGEGFRKLIAFISFEAAAPLAII